jgi:hypothetical protein
LVGKLVRALFRVYRRFRPVTDITRVTVRDGKFQVIKELIGEEDLAAFRRLWFDRVEADPASWRAAGQETYGHGAYKIDVRRTKSGNRKAGNRWLYDPSGLAKPLVILWRSILVAPLYRLRSPQEFNRLTGIAP